MTRREGVEARLSPRELVLWRVAGLYRDLVEPLNSGSGVPGTGEGVPVLSEKLYTATVREFERLLRVMRDDRHASLVTLEDGEKVSVRQCRWHLVEWHLRGERVMAWPKPTVRANEGRKLVKLPLDEDGRPLPRVRVLRHPQAREHLAAEAVRWMAANWRLPVEPMLPQPVIEPIRAAA